MNSSIFAQFYSYLSRAKSYFILLAIAFFFASSCSDSGCIEADDFGEYETQVIEVLASANSDSCFYDPSLSMTDAAQGSGLKNCFISGNVEIYDEDGQNQSSSTGCSGLPGVKFQNLCITQCLSNCNSNLNENATSGNAEPNWKSTSQKSTGINGGVTIRPESEIKIRATGLVQLGGQFQYPYAFVRGDQFLPQSYQDDWSQSFIDFSIGKIVSLSFSGQITDNSKPNGGNSVIGKVGSGPSTALDNKIYNASRRLVAYIIPHPQGYSFDPTQNSEKAGSVGVPLMADPNMWQCEYQGDEPTQSNCTNKSYSSNGYQNVDDLAVNSTFPITSKAQSATLGTHGGIIRWDGDTLKSDKYDPLLGVDCEVGDCQSFASTDEGAIIGDLSAATTIKTSVAAKVSFKFLISNPTCNTTIEAVVRSGGDDISSHSFAVSNSVWSSEHISLEPNQELFIDANSTTYVNSDGQTLNCGRALGVKFAKYHDIKIAKSGLVSFATLGGLSGGTCTINARIINPKGNKLDLSSSYKADYYEYGDFSSDSDPLNQLVTPVLSQATIWDNGTINNGSKKVFLRKGQIIRFSPESWNSQFESSGGARECGIGMAMRIEPRPALLCRGYGGSEVENPQCVKKYEGGNLIGCEEQSYECLDSQNSAYCPNSACYKPVSCVNGSPSTFPKYTRTSCSLGSVPSACEFPEGAQYSQSSCNSCSLSRLNAAQQSPFISQSNISKCYDLESFQGSVKNIPITGFTDSQLNDSSFSKGAKTLGTFNGDYGNMASFSPSGKQDIQYKDNAIFNITKILNVSTPGRMKLIFLDGDNFKDIGDFYSDNSSAGLQYNGENGFRVGFSSNLEFSNGAWLETILCAESSDSSVDCKSSAIPTQIAGQPEISRLKDPKEGEVDPISKTAFYYDGYGTLTRSKSRSSDSECINALVGDVYYCHTDKATDVKNIRLSFKIKDPEIPDCYIANPTKTKTATDPSYDGVIMTNAKFRASDCDVNSPTSLNPLVKNGISTIDANGNRSCQENTDFGKTCPANSPECTNQFICANKYSNNSGKYLVTIRVKNPESTISSIVDDVVSPVIEVMDGKKDGSTIGQSERIYKLIIADSRYQAILSMAIIVMFTFYGLTYLMGVSDASLSDIINRILKIGLIYLFVGPNGWYWFNEIVVAFFKNGTDYISFLMASSFDNSPELESAINNYDFYDKSVLFKSVDNVFGLLFASTVQKKISALLFASIFGWVYLIIIYYAIFAYIYAVSTAILLYLTAQVFISVLFILGPIFFVFALFGQTKEMFDKWLQQLIGFSLQQIFLLTTLAFFNMMMYEVIKMSLGYKVCWEEVWTINIITRITLMSFWTIPSLPPSVDSQIEVGAVGKNDGIPSLFSILFIWVIAKLMHEFVEFMTNVASSIGGGLSASSLGSGLKKSVNDLRKGAGDLFDKKIKDKTYGEAKRIIDKKIFSSGKKASQARKENKRAMAKMQDQKSALSKSGKKAVRDFKKKHGTELAGLSKEKQAQKLQEIKDKAMYKKGEKLGLGKGEVDKLKADKGLKYEGDNIIGLAAKAARQSTREGGSLFKSMNKQKVNTDFTKKQAKEAIKQGDEESREKFVKSIKDGDIFVGQGRLKSAKNAPKNALKSTAKDLKDLKNKISNPEYNQAAKELVSEGEISKMTAGTSWSRNDVEKKKIRQRMKQNKKERSADIGKRTGDSTIASLEMEAQFRNEEAGSKSSGEVTRSSNILTSVVGRKKLESLSSKKAELVKDAKKQSPESKKAAYQAQIDGDEEKGITGAAQDLAEATSQVDKYQEALDEKQQDPDYQSQTQEVANLLSQNTKGRRIFGRRFGGAISADQVKANNARIAEIKGTGGLDKKNAEIDSLIAKQNKAKTKQSNAQIRQDAAYDQIRKIDDSIEEE